MTTDHTEQITAQIERFDRMQAKAGDKFADQVGNEWVELSHDHSFEAVLVEEPRIVAVANIDLDGDIEHVQIPTGQGQLVDVDPGSGLWTAMELWLADMRETWSED